MTPDANSMPVSPIVPACATFTYLLCYYQRVASHASSAPVPVSPIVPACATLAYLLCLGVGQRWMRRRPAFNLTGTMVLYNVYQVALNAWWCAACVHEVLFVSSDGSGTAGGRRYNVAFLVWVHYNNKFVELADTAFMVLRKKNKQVNFLHVYHHAMLIWAWYFVCAYAPGGEAYFGALCNSAVHVVMYLYYAMSLLRIKCPWKRYITRIQMAQFVVCFGHAVWCLATGSYPRWLCFVNLWVMVNMLVLFGRFYVKTYRGSSARKNGTS